MFPKFYGLPKIHKKWHPLRPIVLSRDSVTYGVAKILAKILRPLVGKSPHHTQSTKDLVYRVSMVTLLQGDGLCSYDVTALLTSVSIDPAVNIIRELLEQDSTFCDSTVLSLQNIIKLLWFCLHNTYFSFQNKFFEQIEGVAMGSPVSPIVANLYMENLERKALSTASTPRHWFRFLDDTFVIQYENQKQIFLDHINNVDPAINFTEGGNQDNSAIPFLDTLVKPEADNSYLLLCTGNPPTLTNTYSEIVTIILLLSIVLLVPLHTGQKLFVLGQSSSIRKYSILERL